MLNHFLSLIYNLEFLDGIHHQNDDEADLLLPPLKSKGKWYFLKQSGKLVYL